MDITLNTCVAAGITRLRSSAHRERARMDAEMLLLHMLGRNKAWLMAHSNETVSEHECGQFLKLLDRRCQGEPIQYITGECEFYGLPFKVSPDVLIPRPETEHLVERVCSLAEGFPHVRIVDVGTGSGAIAVALAHQLPSAAITATDLSEPALHVARENAARNGVGERIRFVQGDLLVPVAGEQFEILVSNPPYVSVTDRPRIAVEVREYEPTLALFGGEDGLDVYRRLLPAAYEALVPGGFVALEIGYGQAEQIESLLGSGGFQRVEFTADLQGISRVTCAHRA